MDPPLNCAGGDISAQVHWMRHEAEGVISLGFRGHGAALPPFTPGAHIDLHLPNGLIRSYSLMNRLDERGAYRIGVYREQCSRVVAHNMSTSGYVRVSWSA